MFSCPYCGSNDWKQLIGYPYPYHRYNKDDSPLQYISKRMCECGNHYYYEERLGSEIGGIRPNNMYAQVYKQGWYQYKDLSVCL